MKTCMYCRVSKAESQFAHKEAIYCKRCSPVADEIANRAEEVHIRAPFEDELEAMHRAVSALEPLSTEAQARAMVYLRSRYPE